MRTLLALLSIVLCLSLGLSAQAQRRPIGAEGQAAEVPDGDTKQGSKQDDTKKKADAEAKKKAAAAKAEAAERKIIEEEKKRAAAEKAAQKAAEEKKRKKAEAEAKKKAQKEAKKKSDQDKRKKAALKAARSERMILRSIDNIRVRISLTPGAPEIKAVEEIKLDIAEKLKIPDPTFGEYKPIAGAQLVATVSFVEQAVEKPKARKSKKAKMAAVVTEPIRYRVHHLGDAGLYGFHTTLLTAGSYVVKIEGKDKQGRSLNTSFELHPGVWPPPDWESENKKATESSSRRRPISMD